MNATIVGELVGVILIICWVAKMAGLPTKLIPLVALVLGGLGAYFFAGGQFIDALYGIFTGLATTLGYREISHAVSAE